MKKTGDWAFEPDVRVVDAEQVDGGWLVSAIGDRRRRSAVPRLRRALEVASQLA
jgi:hypothetical protein